MAVIPLTVDTPRKVTLGTTYQEFSVEHGRNLLVEHSAAVYYHPDGAGLDGAAVDGTEQFQNSNTTAYSIRIPGSGAGRDAVVGGAIRPLNESSHFAFAAVSGSVDLWLVVVNENVSR